MPVSEAVERAMKMETDAMKFYREAAQRTSHPFGRKMFESLVRDEARHLRLLEEILKGLEIDPRVQCIGDIRTVFSELREKMMNRISATTDKKEAIRIALEMETKGFHYYREAAQNAADPKEKALFEVLTKEEERHYQLLNNTYSFLEDTGNWFMWEELSIVEG